MEMIDTASSEQHENNDNTTVVETGARTTTSSLLSLFLSLPYELQRRIVVLYLHPTDAVRLSIVLSNTDFGADNSTNSEMSTTTKSTTANNNRINVVPLRPVSFLQSNVDTEIRVVGSRDESSNIPKLLEPRIHLPVQSSKQIHSITVRTSWKDQGDGNRKGGLYIIATPKSNHVNNASATSGKKANVSTVNHDDDDDDDAIEVGVDTSFVEPPIFDGGHIVAQTTTCAPHEWEDIELTFSPHHYHHASSSSDEEQQEYYYNLWYRVGGGGGHELYLRSSTVQFYILDDVNSTYRTIHDKLYSMGCIGHNNNNSNTASRRGPARRPIHFPRWTEIRNIQMIRNSVEYYLGIVDGRIGGPRMGQSKDDLFYPKLLLSVCESYKNKLLKNEYCDTNDDNDPVHTMLLNEYGISVATIESIDAIIEIIKTDISENEFDWYLYNESCRTLRERLHINDNNVHNYVRGRGGDGNPQFRRPRVVAVHAAAGFGPRGAAGVIPLEFQQQFHPNGGVGGGPGIQMGVNGFRIHIPAAGAARPEPPPQRNNDDNNNNDVGVGAEQQQGGVDVPENRQNNIGDNDEVMVDGEVTTNVVLVVNENGDADEDDVRVEPVVNLQPPAAGIDRDAAMPPPAQEAAARADNPANVVNNPDGSVTINIGNLEEIAANAIPVDFDHIQQQMNVNDDDFIDMELPDFQQGGGGFGGAGAANDPDQEEVFGIARAAMAAVFGFNNDEDMNNNFGNGNNNNMNNGFQNIFQQANFGGVGGGQGGGFGGARVFVAGGGGNGGFGGGNGAGVNMFPFDLFNNIQMHAQQQQQRPAAAAAQAPVPQEQQDAPTDDIPIIHIDDDDHDNNDNDDDDAEEVIFL